MKIPIPTTHNGYDLIRRCGYARIFDNRSGHESFVRRLGTHHYPRFHVYLESGMINLHLDQKKPIYEGVSAHAGEYDGPAVNAEVQRIQGIINLATAPAAAPVEPEKTGWLSKFF